MKKCEKCGNEYDEELYNVDSIFCRCPICKRKLSKKERTKEAIWDGIFSICALLIGFLFLFGANAALGYTRAIFLFIIIGGLYFVALGKRNTKRKEKTITAVRKVLSDPKHNELGFFEKYEVIDAISKELEK